MERRHSNLREGKDFTEQGGDGEMSRSTPGDPGGYGLELAEYVRELLPADVTAEDIEVPANAWDCLVVTLSGPDGGPTARGSISPPGPGEGNWWYAQPDFSALHVAASWARIDRWMREDLPALRETLLPAGE